MENVKQMVELIISDSKLAFMQGRYEESLRLAKQALVTKIDFGQLYK